MSNLKRYSAQLPQGHVKKNLNEFTPTNGKTAGKEVIKEFLFQKDVAAWFRGTSHYHIKGANKLFNALRDDGEQETTHRVRTCLNLIGLKPMIASKQIKFLMQISRGNDLIFLWFLMEKHYKTPKGNKPYAFSQNEQLICSAICHLDMVTTLKELDKILPRGPTSCVEMLKKTNRPEGIKESSAKLSNKLPTRQLLLPYFGKYTRPQHYGKRLFLEEPNFKVNFKYYRHFNNPNILVQNETNRWYANYHFNPGKRVVHSIICEVIKTIFCDIQMASLRARSDEILCGHHKTSKAKEAISKHKFILKARDACLKHSLIDKDKHANKIKSWLHDAVQQQICIFRNQAKISPKNYTLKTITSDCSVCDVILGRNGSHATTECKSFRAKQTNPGTSYAFQSVEQRRDKKMDTDDKFKIAHASVQKCDISLEPHKERFNDDNGITPLNSCESFFRRPLMHQPHKFDYGKIFASFKRSEESGSSNLSTENKDRSQMLCDNAMEKSIKKAFKKAAERCEPAAQSANGSNSLKQFPYSASYNAENVYLMDQMLFEAFQHLRKNPKFVWAQLPDAHKVPFLREWIARRFGKEYSPADRAKSYQNSCLVFRALERSNIKLSVPNINSISKNCFVNYNCRKHVARKVQLLKSQFYHSLDCHLLEHTRVFWFAMRGYICSNGPPRKSFYAYMPSRLQDIQHFCLWKEAQ